MSRSFALPAAALTLALLGVSPSWSQKNPHPAPPQPSVSTPSSNPNVGSMPGNREAIGPLYINGRVLMEGGQPVPESVTVGLSCGMRTVQAIHTDAKGYFQFVLGAGPQSNVDYSASDDTTRSYAAVSGTKSSSAARI